MSADATDIVAPTVEGPTNAMSLCLEEAGLRPEDVDYINAHGTGTRANDEIETRAIRAAFGPAADRLSVSSTKSMHGHCLGATAAIEMIACVQAIREGVVPPTAGHRVADPACDLDVTPNVARQREVRAAISNACLRRHQRDRGGQGLSRLTGRNRFPPAAATLTNCFGAGGLHGRGPGLSETDRSRPTAGRRSHQPGVS